MFYSIFFFWHLKLLLESMKHVTKKIHPLIIKRLLCNRVSSFYILPIKFCVLTMHLGTYLG